MRPDEVEVLLTNVAEGTTSVEEALRTLRYLPIEDLDFARLDMHRELRQGTPEAIYAEGKTPEQVVAIARRLTDGSSSPVLATRVSDNAAAALRAAFPEARHHEIARLVVISGHDSGSAAVGVGGHLSGLVTVISAGTSDLPVAEEAAVAAETFGAKVERINDVGVAGLHRILSVQDRLHDSDVLIVVAGMEGALASLVGGISSAPIVAVPTSVGYGASFDGLAALLAMLNSCSAGIAVSNIDNGFGAAVFALRLLNKKQS
ncbi:MAG: nickel pincer cofactor biosynthesis protein LarB [Actinobacteria bacterium]|nr:nickel pincer cofactor biosynthesis protein LarB [Actinomycetota bacterium]